MQAVLPHLAVTISNFNPSLKDEQDEEYVPPDVATLDLTGGAPTDDDAVVAAAAAASSGAGGAEVIITAPASLEESIVAVLDPDQGQRQQFAIQIARIVTQVDFYQFFLRAGVRIQSRCQDSSRKQSECNMRRELSAVTERT